MAEAREATPAAGPPSLAYQDDEAVHVMPLRGPVTLIGRSATAGLLLDHPSVARRHALLTIETDGMHVYDEGSLTGIWVNGAHVKESRLRDGDELIVGDFHLFVVAP
ncbi:MAG: FHA domain-containing protein [Solirubrobacterales bacterium]